MFFSRPPSSRSYPADGFSLLESAIGLIIAGLMVTSVFKGYSMIREARLHKTLAQIVSFQAAYQQFLDQYQAKPGDYSQASSVLGPEARDGGDSGLVEGLGRQSNSESTAFWSHLALAELIPVNLTAPSGPLCRYGIELPGCPLGGGFTVEESPDGLQGLHLILGKEAGSRGNGGLLTPAEAAFFNKRLDNGHPCRGRVQSKEGQGIGSGQCVRANAFYNLRTKERVCVLYVRLD
jgi:type II secretory pathway pseudopilin PulG